MALMAWDDTFGVGSAVLDSDHRILINLLNQLYDAMETGQSRQVVGNVISVLAEYTEHHFRREETLLAQSGFPHTERHLAQHRALEERVRAMRDQWVAGDRAALGEDMLAFLKKWLTDHILGTDKSYRPWVEGLANSGDAAVPQRAAWSAKA